MSGLGSQESIMRTDQASTGTEERVLAVSLELATAKWKVALHDGHREQPAVHTVAQPQAAARLQAVLDLIEQHNEKWSLPAGVRVVVSYEAGQDGFWICRALQARGIECYVVDPASIPVERHKRRAKTDRLDAIKLVINLRAWLRGERDRMHVVHVPSPQDEASRHLMRDRGQLQKEVLQHRDRMRKLLATFGCWDEVDQRHFAGRLARDEVKCHDGATLPPEMRERLLRECQRLALAQQQLATLEKTRQASLPAPARQRRDDLARLKGIGEVGASRLALELFWREFSQPTPSGCLYGAGGPALRQRPEPGRPGHQQTGQPTSARVTGRDRMVLAALPARQRTHALVQRAHPGHGTKPAGPAHRDRCSRTATRHCAVALSERRCDSRWRTAEVSVGPPKGFAGRR
jgi:transposase